ncbi:MAG: GMC oxidoreductase [Pseudomonadota bacterium]
MSRADLQPYYDRACDVLSIPHFDKDYAGPRHDGRPPLNINGSRHITSLPRDHSEVSGRTNQPLFDEFRYGFTDERNVSVYLHANVVGIKLAGDESRIESLEVSTLDGKKSTARATVYVLACGGIENARLLLAANSHNDLKFGSRSDALGRYFQGHTVVFKQAGDDDAGTQVCFTNPPDSLDLYVNRRLGNPHAVLGTTLAGQTKYRSAAFTVTLGQDEEREDGDRHAVRSAATRIDQANPAADGSEMCWCYFITENLPNPQSRITLTDRVDALGMPRVDLEWKYGAEDLEGFERSVAAFARELGSAGQGRTCCPVERSEIVGSMQPSRHHMGTTRMHADPAIGIVDTDLKCHDADNLYITGSSVFPTSGIANPTLTLLALTLRLSDHLQERLGA